MTTPTELYPFATQDGKSIPLDVVKPVALLMQDFIIDPDNIILTASLELCAIYATEHCVIDLAGSILVIDGTTYPSRMFIPKEAVVMAMLPAVTAKIWAITTGGTIFIQGIQKWAGLGLPRQFVGKTS